MGMSGGGSPPPVTVPPPIPQTQAPQAMKASETITQRSGNAIGPAATIQTGPQGLTTPATTANKTLLGS